MTITAEAQEYIHSRNQPVFLEMPIIIGGDIAIRESPAVRWGKPKMIGHYELQFIEDVEIYIPHELPAIPLTIVRRGFFGIKWLAVEGWALA